MTRLFFSTTLLITVVFSSLAVAHQNDVAVSKTLQQPEVKPGTEKKAVLLTLQKDGTVLVDGNVTEGDKLEAAIKKSVKVNNADTAQLHAHPETTHANVIKLIDLCNKIGVTKIRLAVTKKD